MKPHRILFLLAFLMLFFVSVSGAQDQPLPPDGPRPLPPDSATRAVGNYPLPNSGNQPLLVVLVEFSDRDGLFSGSQFNNMFNGGGGFADYFREVSYNKLNYNVTIVGNQGKRNNNIPVAGYVRLDKPISYYADNNNGNNLGNGTNNHGGAIWEAILKLDSQGFDFSPYVTPGTTHVDNLVLMFAGYNFREYSDANGTLQPTAYAMTWAIGQPESYFTLTSPTNNGISFNQYTVCNDRSTSEGFYPQGVCVHEHGHGLGLPDLYSFDFDKSAGVGKFDLMGYGTFGADNGARPFHMGAFSKYFLNWAEPVTPTESVTTIELGPAATSKGSFIKLYPNGDSTRPEYYIIENRQAVGFDGSLGAAGLCEGVTIWHVNENVVNNSIYNIFAGTPGVRVIEGNGQPGAYAGRFDMLNNGWLSQGECADTWKPGQTWTGFTGWTGASGATVEVLGANGDNITVRVTQSGLLEPPVIVSPAANDVVTDPGAPFTWTVSPSAGVNKYQIKMRIVGGAYLYKAKMTTAELGCDNSSTCTYDPFDNDASKQGNFKLKQGKTYEYKVLAVSSGIKSGTAWTPFTVNVSGEPVLASVTDTEWPQTYQWTTANAAFNEYKLQVREPGKPRSTFTISAADAGCDGGGTCSYQAAVTQKQGKNYEWRLISFIQGGDSKFKSKSGWFPYTLNASGTAVQTYPAAGETVTTSPIEYQWTSTANNVAKYIVKIRIPGQPVQKFKLTPAEAGCDADTSCAFTPSMTHAETGYQWIVISKLKIGDAKFKLKSGWQSYTNSFSPTTLRN